MSKISKNWKFRAAKVVKMAVFAFLKLAKIDFLQNQSGRKMAKFPQSGIQKAQQLLLRYASERPNRVRR